MTKPNEEPASHVPPGVNVSKLLEDAQNAFYKDPNVIGVRVGERRKGGETQRGEVVLIVFVKEKLPPSRVDEDYLIPVEFQGMPTDVVAPFGPDAPKDALSFPDSHEHSDDMSFISWERLHEQRKDENGDDIP